MSCTGHYPLKLDHEDIAHCDIHYSSDLVVSVELSWILPYKVRRTSVITDSAIYIFDETNKDLSVGFVKFQKGFLEGTNNIAYNRLSTKEYINKINFVKSEPLKNMIGTFLEAVSFNNTLGDRNEILRAKMVIPTIEAVLMSIREGGRKINIRLN